MFNMNKIKTLAKEQGLSLSYICEKKLGLTKVYFNNITKSNSDIPDERLKIIADTLNTTVEYLRDETEIRDKLPENLGKAFPVGPQCSLPVYGKVSAGNGVLAEENIIGWENADAKYADGEHFFLKVTGDSMSPKIDDGDLIIVRRQTSVDSGTIGVFIVDDSDGFVKKVKYTETHISLISINPYYPPLEFDGADVLKVIVVGKVIELKRKFE